MVGKGGIGRGNHMIKPTLVVRHMALWGRMKCLLTWYMQGYQWVVPWVEKAEARKVLD